MNKYFKIIISLPKTLYLNFKIFKFKQALKLPVFVQYNVKISGIYRGCFIIDCKIETFMIKIGFGGSPAIHTNFSILKLSKTAKSKIIFNGKANFCEGIVLYSNGGLLTVGNNFFANKNCFISFDYNIIFGNDVLIGWNVNIRDSDGHKIFYNNISEEQSPFVKIGNHVWICSFVDILKNTCIDDECVVAYRSLVTGKKFGREKLLAGVPAKEIKSDIRWER